MHQTDAGFINGNFLGIVKNAALSDQKMTLNLEAIDRFLKGQKCEGHFGQAELPRDFKPSYFHPEVV